MIDFENAKIINYKVLNIVSNIGLQTLLYYSIYCCSPYCTIKSSLTNTKSKMFFITSKFENDSARVLVHIGQTVYN